MAEGSQPQAYSAWRVKSRASGTTPLWSSKTSLRPCRPPPPAGAAPSPTGDGDEEEEDGAEAADGDDGTDVPITAACPADTPPSDSPVPGAPPSDAPEAPLGSGPRSPGE
ncbi:hypothetical protein GCM10023323_44020 [Streptomyces thinghirensis]|uniref:Uncharacterized protein n=1 Tax=Streptomyces thinghirensis TaxID=551547 RepID=A0ABP9T8Z7_9ACTN